MWFRLLVKVGRKVDMFGGFGIFGVIGILEILEFFDFFRDIGIFPLHDPHRCVIGYDAILCIDMII